MRFSVHVGKGLAREGNGEDTNTIGKKHPKKRKRVELGSVRWSLKEGTLRTTGMIFK